MAPLKHAILGAGGVGGLIGACLARSGDSVTMVLRPESLAKYPEQLQLESAFGNFSVPVARAAEVPSADVLWITVKATQLDKALASFTKPDSVKAIVPLLNGIDHLAVLRAVREFLFNHARRLKAPLDRNLCWSYGDPSTPHALRFANRTLRSG